MPNSTLVDDILNIAQGEVGVTEDPPESNQNPYGSYFGLDGVPWCALFVSWCYAQAGSPLPDLGQLGAEGGFASCQGALEYATANGESTATPAPGDVALFDWQGDGHSDHTGIVLEITGPTTFTCVEGNTSVGNDSNGGRVMVRRRKHDQVALFWRPTALLNGSAAPADASTDDTSNEAELPAAGSSHGSHDDVANLQRYLSRLAELFADRALDPGAVDGLTGPRTAAALRAWQTRVGSPADGEWGEQSIESSVDFSRRFASELCRLHGLER